MARSDPVRIAKWLGLAFAGVWVANMVVNSGPDAWFFLLLFMPLHLGPTGLAAMLVKASSARADAWFFLVLEGLLVASYVGAFVLVQVGGGARSALGASLFIAYVVPFYQYCAIGLIFFCAYAAGWRARPEWLKG